MASSFTETKVLILAETRSESTMFRLWELMTLKVHFQGFLNYSYKSIVHQQHNLFVKLITIELFKRMEIRVGALSVSPASILLLLTWKTVYLVCVCMYMKDVELFFVMVGR